MYKNVSAWSTYEVVHWSERAACCEGVKRMSVSEVRKARPERSEGNIQNLLTITSFDIY